MMGYLLATILELQLSQQMVMANIKATNAKINKMMAS
jgi:hypothetical protein